MSGGGRILGTASHDGSAKPWAGAAAESRAAIADAVQRAAPLAWCTGMSAVRRNRATHDHSGSRHHAPARSIGEAGPDCELARRQRPAHGPGPDYAGRTENAGPT